MKTYEVYHIKTDYVVLTGTHSECIIWMIGNTLYQKEYKIREAK